MKRLLAFLVVVGILGVFGYRALTNWTIDVNPASVAKSMTSEEASEACLALSGGTEGGYQVCMDGIYLAKQGIQNPIIPDLTKPANWASFKPGYTLDMRQKWLDQFTASGIPQIGGCLFDIIASSVDIDRFWEIRTAMNQGTDLFSIREFSTAYNDCVNGTLYSLTKPEETTSNSANPDTNATTTATLPYRTERNRYWNALCPKDLRPNETLPIVYCDMGEGVKHIQRLLGNNPDGYFGNNTFNALLDFQARLGLPLTGDIDIETWRAIDPLQTGPGIDINGDGLVTPDEFD